MNNGKKGKSGFMYILECNNGSYYVGSTIDIDKRLEQHQLGKGSNHTKKYLPVELVYFEEYQNIAQAYEREQQVKKWRRAKKEALINGKENLLPDLAKAYSNL